MSGVIKELWLPDVVEALFPDNSFASKCKRVDHLVKEGTIVHKPQAGGASGTERNRQTLPAAIATRTDTDTVYLLDEFTSNPVHIPNAAQYELSYDKRKSVIGTDVAKLIKDVHDWFLYNWLRQMTYSGSGTSIAATVLPTTGAATAGTAPGATGNRKIITASDVKKAQTLFNKQNIAKNDRFLLLDSDLIDQLQEDAVLKARDNGKELDMKNGIIDRLYGFQIMERSETTIYDGSGTPLAPGTAGAAAHCLSGIAFQKDEVEAAIGTVDMFERLNDPTYYGDIYSFLIRAGGSKNRMDAKGIAAIVQTATA